MLVLEDPGRFQAQAEGQNLGAVHAMPCLLSSWRSYPGPAQGANSTPNDEEPEFAQGINARKYQSLAEVSKPPPRGIWQNWWRKAAFPSFPAVGAARVTPWRWVRAAC